MSKGRYPRLQGPIWSALVRYMLFMVTLLLFMLLALGIFSFPISTDDTPFYDHSYLRHRTVERSEGSWKRAELWTEVLSWEPRAFIYHNFLSKEECEYLIKLAKPYMGKSRVIDEKGNPGDSSTRTSTGTFMARGRHKVTADIEKRIADVTFMPVDNGEGLQVLHYEVGQKFDPHTDYFFDEFNLQNGGQRVATFILYLSDVEEGGETVFPRAKRNFRSVPWWDELSECGKGGLSVKPKMGDALLFWNLMPNATVDPLSYHGSCPVIRGNKWSATKWLRSEKYEYF